MSKNVKCTLTRCLHMGTRLFETHEEKRTDVNIAVYMLDDAYQDRFDQRAGERRFRSRSWIAGCSPQVPDSSLSSTCPR